MSDYRFAICRALPRNSVVPRWSRWQVWCASSPELTNRRRIRFRTSGSGAQALDTFKFSYGIAGDGSVKPHRLTGTITVHDQSNLIVGITMQTTVTGANPQIADSGQLTFKTVMTFSDYGVPVSVQAPTGAVPHGPNVGLSTTSP